MYRGITSVFVGAGVSTRSNNSNGHNLTESIGPAHAMHFLTYEAVKQAFGGNDNTKHHPFVGGK